MAIALRAVSGIVSGGVANPLQPPSLPSGTQVGDMVAYHVIVKYASTTITNPTSWDAPTNNQANNTGLTDSGNDAGNIRVAVYFREYDGVWTMPDIPLSGTPNCTMIGAISYSKAAGEVWDPVLCANAVDNTGETTGVDPPASATTLDLAAGDWLGGFVGQNGNAGIETVPMTVDVSGVTFGAAVTRLDNATSAGTDLRGHSIDQPYTSGTASAGPDGNFAVSGANAGCAGAMVFYRLRVTSAGGAVVGEAHLDFGFTMSATGISVEPSTGRPSRAPIPAVLMVNTPGDWDVHPYYSLPITPLNWGRQSDLDLIDAALAANYPNRTRTVVIAEDDGTADGRCVTALNWAMRHYDEVQAVALRAPIIDLEERHARVGGAEATSIETAYGGSGTYLALPGLDTDDDANAKTPDTAALDITGDLDFRIELRPDAWVDTGAFWRMIAAKWVETGNQRSWRLAIRHVDGDSGALNGRLQFYWSTTGTNSLEAISTAGPLGVLGDTLGAIRVTLDVVNGTDKTVTFYTAPTIGGTWTQLGSPVTTAGNTSVFSSSAPLEIGTVNNGTDTAFFTPFKGIITKAELRNGIAGTVVANPDFTVQTPGATSFADGTGKTWTITPDASINAGFTDQMPSWNPGYTHRRDMAAQMLGDKLHIWRDPSDAVTPIAVTDEIATDMRATLHATLGTPAAIVPTGQDWVNQKAWVEMKKLHDYARTGAATSWKGGDGGRTVVLPDGRWFSYFADSFTGLVDADDTWGAGYAIIRNQVIIHDSSGAITGQWTSSGTPGVSALVPNQTEFPNSFYWPIGGGMESGLLHIVCLLREGGGFGTPIDTVIVTLDPSTFAEISVTSTGDPDLLVENIVVDTDSGFTYATGAHTGPDPIRIFRVPIGQLLNLGAWTFWDGSGWNTDRLAAAGLLENAPGGGTRPLQIHSHNNGWDIRRHGTGWLAVVRGWHEPYMGVYYSTVPQGPWTHYMNVPTHETGGTRFGGTIYAYTPFWHPERDPAPDRLVVSYNALTLAGDPVGYVPPATTDQDFLFYDPHFVVVPIHRELF